MKLTNTCLPSGVRIICLSPFESDLASLAIVFHVGFTHEERENLGISHMVEHLCFSDNSTHSFPQFRGAIEHLGGMFNGYTGDTTTAFSMELLVDHWKDGLRLLRDIAWHPKFTPEACTKEVKVLEAETGQLKQKWLAWFYERGWFRNYSVLLKDEVWGGHMHPRRTFHRYGDLTSEQLRLWHREHYRLDNMAVVAVGRINPDELQAEVENCMIDIKTGSGGPPHPVPCTPPDATRLVTRIGEPFWNQSVVATGAWNSGSLPNENAVYDIIHEHLRHRSFDSLRLKHSLAYQTWSCADRRKNGGCFLLGAMVKRGNEDRTQDLLQGILTQAAATDISAEELDGIRSKLLAQHARKNANPGWYTYELAMAAFDEYSVDVKSYPQQLREVTPSLIREVLGRLTTERGALVVRQIPVLSVPATVCLAALVLIALLLLAGVALMK